MKVITLIFSLTIIGLSSFSQTIKDTIQFRVGSVHVGSLDLYDVLFDFKRLSGPPPYTGDKKTVITAQAKNGLLDMSPYQIKDDSVLVLNLADTYPNDVAYVFLKRNGYWIKVHKLIFTSIKIDTIFNITKRLKPFTKKRDFLVIRDIFTDGNQVIERNTWYYGLIDQKYYIFAVNKNVFKTPWQDDVSVINTKGKKREQKRL